MLGSAADAGRHGGQRYADAGYTVLCLDYPLAPQATLEDRGAHEPPAAASSPLSRSSGTRPGATSRWLRPWSRSASPTPSCRFTDTAPSGWNLEPAYLHLPPADPQLGGAQWYLWSRQHGRRLYEVTRARRDPSEDDGWIDRSGIDHSSVEFPDAGHGFEVPDTDEVLDPVLDFVAPRLG